MVADYVPFLLPGGLLLVMLLYFLYRSIKTIPPYAQGVVTVFGRYKGTRNPGFNLVPPLSHVILVDCRPQIQQLPPSAFARTSGAPEMIGGSVEFHVTNAANSVFHVVDARASILDEFRERLARAIAATPAEGLAGGEWQLAERVRAEVAESAEKFGVTVDRVMLVLTTPAGPLEYFAGNAASRLPPVPRDR